MKVNKIIKVDASLVPAAIATIATGIGIHLADHSGNHVSWHNWSVAHILFSVMFIILACFHVRQHIGWYRNLLRPSKKPRIITIMLTLAITAEFLTGFTLLAFIDGEGSSVGHIHWIGGLTLSALAAGHLARRFKILFKGLRIN